MKRKKFKESIGNRLLLEQDENGFTLWVQDPSGTRHWLIEGSDVFNNGIIDIANDDTSERCGHAIDIKNKNTHKLKIFKRKEQELYVRI